MLDLGEPTHTLVPCWMPKPLPPRDQWMGWFAPAQMLPMRIFVLNLTRYGVSKVLLLLVAICQLLERLNPRWALSLESPWFCFGSPNVTCTFLWN